MNLLGALCLTTLLAAPQALAQSQDMSAVEPFAAASVSPADITAYIHVEDAASMRKELADRPIAAWLNSIFQNGQGHEAWMRLAKGLKLEQGQLFDLCLGQRFTLILRGGDEWALLTEVNPDSGTQLLAQLKPRVRQPQAGMAIFELPEQELLIARAQRSMLLGPAQKSKLFFEVLPRVGHPKTIA